MSLERWIILLTALVFAAYGVGFVLAPQSMLAWATGTYGGLSLAVGLVLYWLGQREAWRPLGLRVVIALMLGMGGGRLVGMVVDGGANAVMYTYLVLEIVAAAFATWLLRRLKQPEH